MSDGVPRRVEQIKRSVAKMVDGPKVANLEVGIRKRDFADVAASTRGQ
jgi:acetolactate synthase small subunit